MPRAFLVKHKKSTKCSNDRIDDGTTSSSMGSEELFHLDTTDTRDETEHRHPSPFGESNFDLKEKNKSVSGNNSSKLLENKLKALSCLTIPRPFTGQTGNVLRSMLYKSPGAKTETSPRIEEFRNSSLSSPLVKASAHSAFDKVVPGAPRPGHDDASFYHQHNARYISPQPHMSGLQRVESQRISNMAIANRQATSSDLRARQDHRMTTSPDIKSTATLGKDEPLDLQIKRPLEDPNVMSSRPSSVESNTNSRESLSPLHQNDIGHRIIPRKTYLPDRHQAAGMAVDISPPAGSVAGRLTLEAALRTPRYLPSTPHLGDLRNPMHWAYAAYYQQYGGGGPYGPFYSSRQLSTAVPGDLYQQQSYPNSNASRYAPSKRDLPNHIDTSTSESYRSKNIPKSSGINASPSSPSPSSPSHSDERAATPPPDATTTDTSLPDTPPPHSPAYLTEHLNTIRTTTSSRHQHHHRPAARQPILGLEYVQNGNDVSRVNEIGSMKGDAEEDTAEEAEDRQGVAPEGEDRYEDDLEDLDEEHMMETTHDDEENMQSLQIDANATLSSMDEQDTNLGNETNTRATSKPPQPKKYKCDVCFKGFSRSNTLVTHKRIHTGDKPFKCEMCGRAFRQPGNLTRHRLTHTTVKPYVCLQCDKAFNRASNLHTHMRTHTNYKPFTCPYCSKGFHQKIDMKIHSYTHTGEKPHKCKTCGRGFKQLTHLTYHMRTHSAVKMYTCTYCGKGFNQKGNLQAHIYGHTGERPYRCEICDKGFTLASTLNTHRRTHAEKKPFQCQYCRKEFYQKNALKSHLIASHPYTGESLL